jgi:serine/threonine protein kinase
MATPTSTEALLELLHKSGLLNGTLDTFLEHHKLPPRPAEAADVLIEAGLLTRFQARHLLAGKHRGFLLGPYKILEPLGKGGMGAVFHTEHTKLRQPFALKVLPPDKAADPAALQRFYREARAVAALDHPNIIRAYDINQAGDLHYFVMEYVKGENLEDVIRKRGPVPYRQAVDYALQAAAGLDHAHQRGLVHRDIKPANLLLDEHGTIKVLDMGLARFFKDPTDDLTRRLADSSVLGTADYIAPEQALDSHEADIRADIYSLGATLYSLIQGHPPFGGKSIAAKLIAHQMRKLEPLHKAVPEVPERLSAVVSRMMAKKPEDRYQTPAEVIAALTPYGLAPPRRPWWHIVAVAAAILVLVTGGTWWLAGRTPAAPEPTPDAKR